MKNNNGFAVTGILYAILVLFLFLILLILNNFQARKVLFDRQKENVLEKLNDSVPETPTFNDYIYDSENELQEFITPKDGIYKIDVWSSANAAYVSGNVNLYQGIKLYVAIGYIYGTGSERVSSVRTEKNNLNTIILKADGYYGSSSNFIYDESYINANGEIDDIKIEPVKNVKNSQAGDAIPAKATVAANNGYVEISFVSELE